MKEHPLNLYPHEVRAIQAGRQTQLRRLVKPQPHADIMKFAQLGEVWKPCWGESSLTLEEQVALNECQRCPFGLPGDRLWVRETWCPLDLEFGPIPRTESHDGDSLVAYRADHQDPNGDGPGNPMPWRPSIHMPRRFSRLTLEIVRVRCERVQSIHGGDTALEGIDFGMLNGQMVYHEGDFKCVGGSPIIAFRALWDSLHGPRAWERNDWVWVRDFRVVSPCAPACAPDD